MGAYVGLVWPVLEHLGLMLRSSWLQLGPLGPILAPSWALLEPILAFFSWSCLEPASVGGIQWPERGG